MNANDRYQIEKARAEDIINKLEQRIERHAIEQEKHSRHWTYVGEMERVNQLLQQALAFLSEV